MWVPAAYLNCVICWCQATVDFFLKKHLQVYTFVLQKDKTNIELAISQGLLVIAAIAVFSYRLTGGLQILSYLLAAVFLGAAFFAKYILQRTKINKLLLLAIAAAAVFFATWQVFYPIILIVYGFAYKYIIKAEITVNEAGVTQKSFLNNRLFEWGDFNAVMLKDGVLVLDYKNNKVKYLAVNESFNEVDFNAFCQTNLQAAPPKPLNT